MPTPQPPARITDPPPLYVCPRCGRYHWHPDDAERRQCLGCGYVDRPLDE